ncbi:MAG: hypothetical protein FJ276_28225 [Planctomycetes bacterium]|nr:hypothetical protein [Planctomycetota bacterium]
MASGKNDGLNKRLGGPFSNQQSAICNQQSAISNPQSAIIVQHSPFSIRRSVRLTRRVTAPVTDPSVGRTTCVTLLVTN